MKTKKQKVYCGDCKYYRTGITNDYCFHPKNLIKYENYAGLELLPSWAHKVNEKMNCKLKEIKKKWWKFW